MSEKIDFSNILIGGMRYKNRQTAIEVIKAAIDSGFNYIDTSPLYCYSSEQENSESWIGEVLKDPAYRSRVMVATKSSPGNLGMGIGKFNEAHGINVRKKKNLFKVIDQSLSRLNLDSVDFYHMWAANSADQFYLTQKSGGYYEGIREYQHKFKHFGLTTHATNDVILDILKQCPFKTVTVPLNVLNNSRAAILEYCKKNDIKVIAMNPFAGGFLTVRDDLKELALKYLLSLDNVYPLIGFSEVHEVMYAKKILDEFESSAQSPHEIAEQVGRIINPGGPICSSCCYCSPCPKGLEPGKILMYYNFYKYLNIHSVKDKFIKNQTNNQLRLDLCNECGKCAAKCPNALPLKRIIPDAKALLYSK